jgi:hypothetical protein
VATIDEDIRALYVGPVRDFTESRNALAARVKKTGNPLAADIKALKKPAPAAAATSRLLAGGDLAPLVALGRRLREPGTSADEIRAGLDKLRSGTQALVDRAVADPLATGVQADRLRQNLDALIFDPRHEGLIGRGWLDADLEAPGFELLAALQVAAAARGGGHERIAGSAPSAGVAAAGRDFTSERERRREAEVAQARADAAKAEAEAAATRTAAQEAAQAADRARFELARAQQEADRTRQASIDAQRTADAAHATAERAKAALRRLES